MNGLSRNYWTRLSVVFMVLAALQGCMKHEVTERDFVGKWQSSRVTTPIYLYENGEWEMMWSDGSIKEYGVWQKTGDRIMWSFKFNDTISHELNKIVSVNSQEFTLRETNGSITTFTRLAQ